MKQANTTQGCGVLEAQTLLEYFDKGVTYSILNTSFHS